MLLTITPGSFSSDSKHSLSDYCITCIGTSMRPANMILTSPIGFQHGLFSKTADNQTQYKATTSLPWMQCTSFAKLRCCLFPYLSKNCQLCFFFSELGKCCTLTSQPSAFLYDTLCYYTCTIHYLIITVCGCMIIYFFRF